MIIVKLSGGLGNQMFQYAFGRKMAYQNKDVLKIDKNNFGQVKEETPRKYCLDVFNIQENFASRDEITKLKKLILKDELLNKFNIFLTRKYVREQSSIFEKKYLQLKGNIYLDGYWQSYRYFEEIEDNLLKEFSLKNPLSSQYQKTQKLIQPKNTVSIHVRRGDYLKKSPGNKYLSFCGLDYYNKSVKYITDKVTKPIFLVFSDDIDWVKKNLNLKQAVYITPDSGLKDYEELMLMSECQHNIIANSSFSWWSGWLNKNPDKIVIAPNNWFDDQRSINSLIPKKWVLI